MQELIDKWNIESESWGECEALALKRSDTLIASRCKLRSEMLKCCIEDLKKKLKEKEVKNAD